MKYTLENINELAKDPAAFVAACEKRYQDKVTACAKSLAENSDKSPIIMLAGPSGSGKTTTAMKLKEVICGLGHDCQVVSMDDYFKTVDPATHPRDSKGNIDFESPHCMDIPLFIEHMGLLRDGKSVKVPHFDFPNQRRHPDMFTELLIPRKGLCILEGIHALNPMFSEGHEEFTQKVYVSARSNISFNGTLLFKGTWVRLVRRMIRDNNFRGLDAVRTMNLWGSVRHGEKAYISPYKDLARHQIDTHMLYETCILRGTALPMLDNVRAGCDRERELRAIKPALEQFPGIDLELLPKDSLLREFVGNL
ncbi:MAG: nucleoside kinase [Oscillospiraceae bacterium]|nr:nucleoside kinase [Oscillospiraceae bacterium]